MTSHILMMCSDFLTRSYDIGGVISVMALSSLFILMTQHGLEYPNFYEKLYALLVPSIFLAKHRSKFFQVILITTAVTVGLKLNFYNTRHIGLIGFEYSDWTNWLIYNCSIWFAACRCLLKIATSSCIFGCGFCQEIE